MSKSGQPGRIYGVLKIGEGMLSLSKKGVSETAVCAVLGWEWEKGTLQIWVDRLMHARDEIDIEAGGRVWQLQGCWTSILSLRCDKSEADVLMAGCLRKEEKQCDPLCEGA